MSGNPCIAHAQQEPIAFFVPSKVLPNGTFKHFAVNPHEIVLFSLEMVAITDE